MTPFTIERSRLDEGENELGHGYSVQIAVDRDDFMSEPWNECDGHGPVRRATRRETVRDKSPGERVLLTERGELYGFYDFQEAVKIAKRDGWDAPPYQTGTRGQRAARAVERDFQMLADWCRGDWYYVTVSVDVFYKDEHIGRESCGGVESLSDWPCEMAAELIEPLVNSHREARELWARDARREFREARYWAQRDVVTQ